MLLYFRISGIQCQKAQCMVQISLSSLVMPSHAQGYMVGRWMKLGSRPKGQPIPGGVGGGVGGGGGLLIFSSYVGLDPASTVYQKKKYLEYRAYSQNIWNFSNPKKYPHSVHWPSGKTLKCIEVTPKTSPVLWWPPKISTKSSYPRKYSFFWKPPKILKIKILNPKRWSEP